MTSAPDGWKFYLTVYPTWSGYHMRSESSDSHSIEEDDGFKFLLSANDSSGEKSQGELIYDDDCLFTVDFDSAHWHPRGTVITEHALDGAMTHAFMEQVFPLSSSDGKGTR